MGLWKALPTVHLSTPVLGQACAPGGWVFVLYTRHGVFLLLSALKCFWGSGCACPPLTSVFTFIQNRSLLEELSFLLVYSGEVFSFPAWGQQTQLTPAVFAEFRDCLSEAPPF